MKRFLSVWLPRWPVERRRLSAHRTNQLENRPANPPENEPAKGTGPQRPETPSGAAAEDLPLVLSSMSGNGPRITATNAAADRLGLHPGMALADARAIFPALAVEHADEQGDVEALARLALWCQCFSPLTRPDPAPDSASASALGTGIMLDITGCAHLFGGETGMIAALAARLARFGLTARLAIAPTIGAAWAMARYGQEGQGRRAQIVDGPLHEALAPLPVAALRLDEATLAALRRLGLKRIGDLLGKPRAPLAARFGPKLAERLDQALGRAGESFEALAVPSQWRTERRFPEPLITFDAIETAVRLLACDLGALLERDGKATRRLELRFYRVDGWSTRREVRTSAPSRQARHLARLLCERLDAVEADAGFGFEAMTLDAFDVDNAEAFQAALEPEAHEAVGDAAPLIAPLMDRLVNRFGAERVVRYAPHASHLPERAARPVSVLKAVASAPAKPALTKPAPTKSAAAKPARAGHGLPEHDWETHLEALVDGAAFGRPLLLLARPEPVTALFTVPDGPPVRFEWRRVSHRIARAEGPERIAPEWWRVAEGAGRLTRDYYRVEDENGRRFWLYREGLFERSADCLDAMPAWFIHGIFS